MTPEQIAAREVIARALSEWRNRPWETVEEKARGLLRFEADAALSALRSAPEAARLALIRDLLPAGYAVVPAEPTREMWAASGTAVVNLRSKHHDAISEAAWRAMIAAAQGEMG